jgi:hypothetical protein
VRVNLEPSQGRTFTSGDLSSLRLNQIVVPNGHLIARGGWQMTDLEVHLGESGDASGHPLDSSGKVIGQRIMPGWESKFSIEWKVQPEPDGTSFLFGRIASHYGEYASPFRVLGKALVSVSYSVVCVSGLPVAAQGEMAAAIRPSLIHVTMIRGHNFMAFIVSVGQQPVTSQPGLDVGAARGSSSRSPSKAG